MAWLVSIALAGIFLGLSYFIIGKLKRLADILWLWWEFSRADDRLGRQEVTDAYTF